MATLQSQSVGYDVQALRREEFPVSATDTYLNHAGISPLPQRTMRAMQHAVELMAGNPSANFQWFMDRMVGLQEELRGLVNGAYKEEFTGVQSTSVGFNLLAPALNWQTGDNVVMCDVEFPSNVYPWRALQQYRGVEVRMAPNHELGATVEGLASVVTDRTRVITVSSLQFISGHRSDLMAIGQFCKEHDILLSVDCIQSVGHIPIDVQAMNIAMMSCGGQKSLLGPTGYGFLYVRKELAEQMQPTFVAGNSVDDYAHWLPYKDKFAAGAARFATGTWNLPGMAGLYESVRLLRKLGVANIDAYTTTLIDYAIEGLTAMGLDIITPRHQHGPIVTFRVAPTEEETVKIMNALAQRKIATVRHWNPQGEAFIRASVHCYNTSEDIDRLLAALKELRVAS